MSTPEALFTTERPPPWPRLCARVAVVAALALAKLPPRRIRRTLSFLRRGAPPATHQQARAARDAVVAVSVTCAGKGCLPRAIATALLCRMRGCWPTVRIGARTAPFGAHAWVEAEGRPVGESEQVGTFHPLLTVPPHTLDGTPC
ncbi:lasso peptide biosynthesis B2 protein [Actinosynnema sp. CS-041913]|uniref:lasso peptide biosynthesis B2 protein n=1 Tax=Actinosynnema sp. CS-041913 TaxID=3239917 RepID=UPI003D8D7310